MKTRVMNRVVRSIFTNDYDERSLPGDYVVFSVGAQEDF